MRNKLTTSMLPAFLVPRTDRHSSVGLAESPKLARFALSFVAALFVLLVAGWPTEGEAQGLTCGWCIELDTPWGTIHGFVNGGDKCGWPNPGPAWQCSRCGGTSMCHGLASPLSGGPCHIPCGGTAMQQSVSDAVSDLRSGLGAMQLERVAEAIVSTRDGFSVEYLPEAGRIDLVLACAPSMPARTVPVPPEIRSALDQAMKEPAAAAIASRGPDAPGTQALEE